MYCVPARLWPDAAPIAAAYLGCSHCSECWHLWALLGVFTTLKAHLQYTSSLTGFLTVLTQVCCFLPWNPMPLACPFLEILSLLELCVLCMGSYQEWDMEWDLSWILDLCSSFVSMGKLLPLWYSVFSSVKWELIYHDLGSVFRRTERWMHVKA